MSSSNSDEKTLSDSKVWIVGFDGSSQCINGVFESFKLAGEKDRIILVTMIETVSSGTIGDTQSLNHKIDQANEIQKEAVQLIGELCNRTKRSSVCKSKLINCIDAREGFLEYIEKRKKKNKQTNYIVVGSRGLGTISRLLLGSFSDYIVRYCESEETHILVTKETSNKLPELFNAKDDKQFISKFNEPQTFVVALDSSDESEIALNSVISIIANRKIKDDKIEIILVIDSYLIPTADVLDCDVGGSQEQMLAKKYTSKISTDLAKKGINHEITLLDTSKDVRDEILKFSNEKKSNYLAMGSRGRGTFKRFLLGSVSDYCTQHSKIPIFISKKNQQKK